MKQILKIISIFILASCQTLGFNQEDPNGPVKLDLNYESFMSESWLNKAETPLINFNFFGENIESEMFFDINGTTVFSVNDNQLSLINYDSGEVQKSYGAATKPKSVVSRPTPEQRSPLHVTAAFNRHESQQTSMLPRKPEQEAMHIQFSASEPKNSQSGTHELDKHPKTLHNTIISECAQRARRTHHST